MNNLNTLSILSKILLPFGLGRSGTSNLLILEDLNDSSNVSFLAPLEFIGGRIK